ncbi:MAG: hydroxymethylbilane synthase [Pyrinomonadaceae bacterium]
MNKRTLVIGSRGSKLALWQAEWVKARLAARHAHLEIRIDIIKTTGDVLKNAPLSVIGGRGVFTKELEEALRDKRIDLAVHSLKDLPTRLPDELSIAAVTEREDPRDALVLRADLRSQNFTLRTLPEGSIVGTSSLRRLAQLNYARPDLRINELRGNVDTRLRKLDAGDYDAIILAAAGLRRLDFTERISAAIEPKEMLPAVGQGALGIETRADDALTIELLATLDHAQTRRACIAERALLRELGGGCQVPIAAHAVVVENHLQIEGLVAALSGNPLLRESLADAVTNDAQAERAGAELANRLLNRGAASLLDGLTMQSVNQVSL